MALMRYQVKNFFGVVALCIVASGCTYSEHGCMIGTYCLIPFDGGSVNASAWVPTVNATGPTEVVAAKCDMLAHGTVPPDSGFFAAGSPAFVGGAMSGAILQQGMKTMSYVQNVSHDCMVMNGFQKKT